MRRRKAIICLCLILITAAPLIGCSKKNLQTESVAKHFEVIEDSRYGSISMEFSLLDGEDIRSFTAKRRKQYTFKYEYLITEGNIILEFRDSKDNVLSNVLLSEDEYKTTLSRIEKDSNKNDKVNIHSFSSTMSVISADEQIKIAIVGSNAKGKLKILW